MLLKLQDNDLAPTGRHTFIVANGGLVHWQIYPSVVLDQCTIHIVVQTQVGYIILWYEKRLVLCNELNEKLVLCYKTQQSR